MFVGPDMIAIMPQRRAEPDEAQACLDPHSWRGGESGPACGDGAVWLGVRMLAHLSDEGGLMSLAGSSSRLCGMLMRAAQRRVRGETPPGRPNFEEAG